MDLPWNIDSTLLIAEDWVVGGLMDRRLFMSISGTSLAGAVAAYLARNVPGAATHQGSPGHGEDPLLAQVEQSIPLLQRLDDAQGGGAHLQYVGAQVRAVALVLRQGGHNEKTMRRLLVALADLAQLAGWMALDAGRHGLAQRYLLTGLRAAYDAHYNQMAAHILADLSYQAASLGESSDSVLLGEAALRASTNASAAVRASVMSRLSFAYAGAGRAAEFEHMRLEAIDVLANRTPREPTWMYYLTPNHLACQAGYSMILMGRRRLESDDPSGARALLRRGECLLRTGAHARPLTDPSQRRALHEGAWLALGYTAHGKLEEACQVGSVAVDRLSQVRSPRSVLLLDQLRQDLRRRQRSATVREFLPDLERALAWQRPSTAAVHV